MPCCNVCIRAFCATLFFTYKLFYLIATGLVLGVNAQYIYQYVSTINSEDFFSKNQFPHCLGMFLGFLFRVSGFLSALKEKIALTYSYILFLVLLMLLSTQYEQEFLLYLVTAVMAFVYVVILRYRRACARRAERQVRRGNNAAAVLGRGGQCALARASGRARSGVAATAAAVSGRAARGRDELITVALPREQAAAAMVAPTAPPYEESCHVPIDPYFHHQQHTPPPSYDEIYEKK